MEQLKTHEDIKAWAQKKVEALKKEFEERNRCEHFCGHSRFTIYDEELARLIVGVYEAAIGLNDNEIRTKVI